MSLELTDDDDAKPEKPTRRPMPSIPEFPDTPDPSLAWVCAKVARIDYDAELRREQTIELMKAIELHGRSLKRIEETLGHESRNGTRPTTGLVHTVRTIETAIGADPDDSLGKPGAGLRGTVAGLARESRQRKTAMGGAAAAGGGIAVAAIELIKLLAPVLGAG